MRQLREEGLYTKQGYHFLRYLQSVEGIEATVTPRDETRVDIWIVNEDDLPKAQELLKEFLKSPDAPRFQVVEKVPEVAPSEELPKDALEGPPHVEPPLRVIVRTKTYLTKLIFFVCVALYAAGIFFGRGAGKELSPPLFLPYVPPLEMALLYDVPKLLDLTNQLSEDYTYKDREELKTLPPDAQALLQQIEKTPYWAGIYYALLEPKQRAEILAAPKFVKIREGEVWRIFSPSLIHSGLFHILFNMLWLWMLGRFVEDRLGALRYLLLTCILAGVSNTCQYLMAGPIFMGYSGVIAGLAGYIWMRQKRAPWEAYPIPRGLFIFLWVYIFGLFGVQAIAFILQLLHIVSFNLPIANTAHVTGALCGMLLGYVPLFSRKES